jgi:hypothetical protein
MASPAARDADGTDGENERTAAMVRNLPYCDETPIAFASRAEPAYIAAHASQKTLRRGRLQQTC